jgi:hypothetical protein
MPLVPMDVRRTDGDAIGSRSQFERDELTRLRRENRRVQGGLLCLAATATVRPRHGRRGLVEAHQDRACRFAADPELLSRRRFASGVPQIAAETAVADECLVALGELDAQPVEDGTALLGSAPRLGEIATDDVPSVADFDLRRSCRRQAPS